MILVYAIFMLFYSLFMIVKLYKMQKKDLLVNEVTKEEEKKLYVIMFIVLTFLIILTGYQSFDFFNSIFNANIEEIIEIIEIPNFLDEYILYGNIGLSILKIIWIPTKITKFILQVVFGTLSVFVFFIHYCLRKNKKIPKYLRNVLYVLSVLNIAYLLVAIF